MKTHTLSVERLREVYLSRSSGRWQARITVCGKCHYLGAFESAELAVQKYQAAAQQHFGEFARDMI